MEARIVLSHRVIAWLLARYRHNWGGPADKSISRLHRIRTLYPELFYFDFGLFL